MLPYYCPMRYFIYLAYDGTNYHGWQIQPNGASVQETLMKALATFLRQDIEVVGAGRTDAGVHAKLMIAHFDFEGELDCKSVTDKLNRLLPPDISVFEVKKVKPEVIVAANISKNSTSINEDAAKDYETSFALLYDFVDMFVVNVSCPNVVGLTALQDITFLSDIVDRLLDLRMYYDEYRPILLKVSPDLSHEQLDEIIEYSLRSGIDGIVAGNTTRSRDGLTSISPEKIEAIGNGGMSGAPVHKKNLELVRYVHTKSEGKLPIIGVGGIMSPEDAKEMMDAGASLVEIYSGFIYEGPSLVKKILKHLEGFAGKPESK